MKASETKFQPIIEGTKQYLVPLFQRHYSWEQKHWSVLWEDLVWLCENEEPKSHFIGSIVTMPTTSVPEGVAKFLLIDGQQRLTTIFTLLTVIRDKARDDNPELAKEIEQTLLVNPFKKGLDYFKLLPTQVDRDNFEKLVQVGNPNDDGRISQCYQFFERKFRKETIDLNAICKVITNRLSVVSIVLDPDDNPHLVFESLNAKGQRLSQSDLIRNYFFMRIHVDEQERIYQQYWNPMQDALGNNLTEFIRHYLMRNGSIVKQGDVYFTLKDRIGQDDALTYLKELATFADYYNKLLNPEFETDSAISESLKRINRLEVTVTYPFLLNCYHDYSLGRISSDSFQKILSYIENIIIRRFICNLPSNQLNKIFPLIYEQAQLKSPSDLSEGVRLVLQSKGYPKDLEFRSQLINSKLYGSGDRRVKTKLILETLEASFNHKEQVDFNKLTIEHIMPQTLTEWWQNHLGEDWQTTHELYLHTIGNLTLTAYNTELSNFDYATKKHYLSESHLELNKHFESVNEWKREEIETRSNNLADLALSIWSYFGESQSTAASATGSLTTDNLTGEVPKSVTILGQTFSVASWRDVMENTLNTIGELEPELFVSLAVEYPRFISKDANTLRSNRQLKNGYYIEVNLSAKSIYRFCVQAIESIGLSMDEWIIETAN